MGTTPHAMAHTTAKPTHTRQPTPEKPAHLPYPATNENDSKLKQYILDQFFSSAFNSSSPFPSMDVTLAHIHLKPDATPYATHTHTHTHTHTRTHTHTHTTISVPYHWKQEIKESLDVDVQKGIIEPVPIGKLVKWCSHMVLVTK